MIYHSWEELFPYEPRDGQAEMMDFIRKNLLNDTHTSVEAQNGFGKTITALAASISANYKRVIFCTRTHEQVRHIVEEVREINHRNDARIRCVVLGARWRLCINPWCERDNITCSEYIERSGNDNICVFDDYDAKGGKRELLIPEIPSQLAPDVLDIRENKAVSKRHGFCPYYLAKSFIQTADVVITPYNFVFSVPQRRSFGLDIRDSVIVVDEGHNLPGICRNLNTVELDTDTIQEALSNIKNILGSSSVFTLVKLRNWIRQFPKNATKHYKEKFAEKGFVYGNTILRELYANGITRKKLENLIRNTESLDESQRNRYGDLYSFLSLLLKSDPEKCVGYVKGDKLVYTILDIRDNIRNITRQNSTFLFMSGTLSPVSSFEGEIGISTEYSAFGNTLPMERFQIEILKEIPNGDEELIRISTEFEKRYDEDVIWAYGKAVSNIVSYIRNGVIVMFPSYKLMETVVQNWMIHGFIRGNKNELRFENGVRIYMEGSGQFDKLIDQYKRSARQRTTALFCVFRGKVTEGTDLPQELCRCIIVFGIPFANWSSPMIKGIQHYYDKIRTKGAGYAWYIYNAMTQVNQGIGRGIRDPNRDFCKVFLLDRRYVEQQTKTYNKLSDWIKENVVDRHGSRFQDIQGRTIDFYDRNVEFYD